MHRPLQIGPVHWYFSLITTLDHGRMGKSELVVITTAENNADRVQCVKELLAVRVSASVVGRHEQRLHRLIEAGNNESLDLPANIARQDHPGFTTGYLDVIRYFLRYYWLDDYAAGFARTQSVYSLDSSNLASAGSHNVLMLSDLLIF
jgi:hypothetical protein